MNTENITKGVWEVTPRYDATGYPVYAIHGISGERKRNEREQKANAILITEAGNVANETGKSPRELVELLEYIYTSEVTGNGNRKWRESLNQMFKK